MENEKHGMIIALGLSLPLVIIATFMSVVFLAPATKLALMNITGEWKSLSRTEQLSITDCKSLWNGKKIEGCVYNAKFVPVAFLSPAAKSDPMTYNGDWKSLSKKAQQSILACETLWNSKQIEGCTYN